METKCEGEKSIWEWEIWQTEEREGVGDNYGTNTC
jgi:hypothetical protein